MLRKTKKCTKARGLRDVCSSGFMVGNGWGADLVWHLLSFLPAPDIACTLRCCRGWNPCVGHAADDAQRRARLETFCRQLHLRDWEAGSAEHAEIAVEGPEKTPWSERYSRRA